MAVQADIEWHLLVCVGVFWCLTASAQCPMVSGDVRRVSEEFLKGYLSAVYGRI